MSLRPAADQSLYQDPLRERLLRTAAEQFLSRGFAQVSMRDLAAECGVTTGAIYNRFRGKLELLAAAIEAQMDGVLEVGRRRSSAKQIALAGSEPGLFERETARTIEAFPSRSALRALLLEGAAAARRDSKVRSKLREEQMQHLKWWSKIYRDWHRGQRLDPAVDIDAVMMLLWSAELGLGILEAYGIELPQPRSWGTTVERFLRSLRTKGSPEVSGRVREERREAGSPRARQRRRAVA